jgi:hypothetical protein
MKLIAYSNVGYFCFIDKVIYSIKGVIMRKKLQYPKEYEIEGLKVVAYGKDILENDSHKIHCEYIKYRTWFCRISVVDDSMGIQICYNARFFDNIGFNFMGSAVDYLRANKDRAIKFYRKGFFRKIFYGTIHSLFTKRGWSYTYWKIRHHFDPTFYLSNKWVKLRIKRMHKARLIKYAHINHKLSTKKSNNVGQLRMKHITRNSYV